MENKYDSIKKHFFKVKKISINNNYARNKIFNDVNHSVIGIVVPVFNDYRNTFSDMEVQVLTIDGEEVSVRCDFLNIENTRITNEKVREKLDKIISESKEIYNYQTQKAKLFLEFSKKTESLSSKITKKKDGISKSFNQIKKARGFITTEDTIKFLNKYLQNPLNELRDNYYSANLKNGFKLEVEFKSNKIIGFTAEKEIDFGKWVAGNYDFVYEEYDRAYYIGDIDDSDDFKKIKSKYFKEYTPTQLNKVKVEQYFGAEVGDKDSLYVYQVFKSILDIECKKENFKEIEKRLKDLLNLI